MACEYRDLPVGYKICRSFSFFFNMFFMTGIGRDDRCHSYCKRNSKRETLGFVPAQEQEPGITTRPPGLRGTARAEWTEGQAGVRLYGKWRGRERKDRVYQSPDLWASRYPASHWHTRTEHTNIYIVNIHMLTI